MTRNMGLVLSSGLMAPSAEELGIVVSSMALEHMSLVTVIRGRAGGNTDILSIGLTTKTGEWSQIQRYSRSHEFAPRLSRPHLPSLPVPQTTVACKFVPASWGEGKTINNRYHIHIFLVGCSRRCCGHFIFSGCLKNCSF